MRLLLLDIETAPHVVHVWGLYDQNVAINQILADGYVLCYAAKWYEKDEVMFDSVRASGLKKMLKGVHKLLEEADAVIHYNGKKFDIPILNAGFLTQGIKPPAPYKQIDIYQVMKSTFGFPSKKLDYVSKKLGFEGKLDHRGHSMWIGCMNGDPECWAEMEKYNRQDVVELENVYKEVKPWIRQHPNRALYDEPGIPVCPNCGGGRLERRGWAYTAVNKYARYVCKGCGKWTREGTSELGKEDRSIIMRPDLG